MSGNTATFSISSYTDSNLVNIGTPLNVSYLIGESYTVDNTNGAIYPNSAVVHRNVYDVVSNIDSLLNMYADTSSYKEWDLTKSYAIGSFVYTYDVLTEIYKFYKAIKAVNPLIPISNSLYWMDTEIPSYTKWNWENGYGTGSLVYTYDDSTLNYRFYKALKLTNPLISLSNSTYWNTYTSQVWVGSSTYQLGVFVHVLANSTYTFYQSLKVVTANIAITNAEYWKPVSFSLWSNTVKYNIGSRVYDVQNTEVNVYACIKTVLPVTRIDNAEYWVPYFNYYALTVIATEAAQQGLLDSLAILNEDVAALKAKLELDTIGKTAEEILLLYGDLFGDMVDLVDSIKTQWVAVMSAYALITEHDTAIYALLWKNMYDANIYINELNVYIVDPIKVLESIKYLDSFQELLANAENIGIVVYVSNLHVEDDPSQKNGAYFIYDANKSRFIKALLGQHDHRNKQILDEISQSFDEISENDSISSKVLTIRKESTGTGSSLAWDFHAQWEDMDKMPDKPTDGKEYVLKLSEEGLVEWTDKISSSIAFVKKEKTVETTSPSIEFEAELTLDDQGVSVDSMLLFQNSTYVSSFTYDYDQSAKILTITLTNITTDDDVETFTSGDFITLIIIRNTSAEMLSKLSDQYVSKKEAIEILSGGSISLRDYVKQESLSKYSLRNHIHTRYAATDHAHWGVYADYYHNHDGLYVTRDDVNQILGNILSINPDLIDIISELAADLETLGTTFVAKTVYDAYVLVVNQRLEDLEAIDDASLYLDVNTGQVSQKVASNDTIAFEPIIIPSYQIKTKYIVDPLPEESEFYTLEDWLDHLLDLVSTEELRVLAMYQAKMKSDRVVKTYLLTTTDPDLELDDFVITNIKLNITTPFVNPITVYLGESILISEDEIIEDIISITSYDLNTTVATPKNLSFTLDAEETGAAVLIVTGYAI